MKLTAILLGLALTPASLALDADPLKVTVVLSPRPYYVGQAIEARVEVAPAPGSPSVEPPRIKDAEVFAIDPDPSSPSIARFVIVPGHAAAVDLPPFRARSGDRSGASRTLKLSVVNVPAEGRTSAFLGGVGTFEVLAEAEPTSVRQGETFDFRVRISGKAAFGSVRAPELNEWNSPAMKIEPVGGEIQPKGTSARTFRYRIRALKAGRLTLPPIPISAFDPATRRYATKATSSLTIRVEEPPRFDPDRLDYPTNSTESDRSRYGPRFLAGAALAAVLGTSLAAWLVARRLRKSRPADPRIVALELSKGLEGVVDDEAEAARAVAEALTTFLHRVGGRNPGVLTPPEARAWFERLTGEPGLADLAETLMTRCDRARFGLRSEVARGLISEGGRFLGEAAEAMGRKDGKGDGPGEAVETAT